LRLQPDPSGQNPIEVVDLVMKIKSHEPKAILLEAKTHLVKDPLIQNYVSYGRIHLQYKEFPEPDLNLQFFGNWREGSYSLNAAYKFLDGSFTSNVELKHIPAAQVVSMLRNYGWLREDYDGRKIWVTMKGQSQGSLKEWEKLPLTISDFRLEGDVGEIAIDYFQAHNLKPFTFKPLKAKIRNLDIDRFLEVLRRPRELKFIGRLGQFSGQLDLSREDDLRLTGTHTGLEFIFSNRGQREVQQVSSLKGDFAMKRNRWSLNVKSIDLNNGKFVGNIRLGADRDFRDIEVKLAAQELTLSPAVQKVMSGGGEIPVLKGALNSHIQNGRLLSLEGSLSSPQFTVDQIQFEKFNSEFNSKEGLVHVSMNAQKVAVKPQSEIFSFFKKIMRDDQADSEFKFKDFSVKFHMTPQDEMKWTRLVLFGAGNKSLHITSDGGWNRQGFLSGQVALRGKPQALWYLSGHRDQPKLTESNGIQSTGH
jgi:hypothetical protein